jgi:hypothetical protein
VTDSLQNPDDRRSAAGNPHAQPTVSRRHTPLRITCAHPHQCSHPTRLRILAQISLFSGLSESELDGIDHRMTAL